MILKNTSRVFRWLLIDLYWILLSSNWFAGEIEAMDSEDDELVPTVSVGGKTVAIADVNDALIAEMTPIERESYIQTYQEYFSHMYD